MVDPHSTRDQTLLAKSARPCGDLARLVTCSALRNDWARTGRWPYEHALIDVSDCGFSPQTSAAITTSIMRHVAVAVAIFPFCALRMIASCARNRGAIVRMAGIAGDLRGGALRRRAEYGGAELANRVRSCTGAPRSQRRGRGGATVAMAGAEALEPVVLTCPTVLAYPTVLTPAGAG
jgi:hypothetical protein